MVIRKTPGWDTFSDSGSRATLAPAAKWQQRRTKKIRIATSVSRSAFLTAGRGLCRAVNRVRGRCACKTSSCRRRAMFSRTRSSRERKELTIHPTRCRSESIMARILSRPVRRFVSALPMLATLLLALLLLGCPTHTHYPGTPAGNYTLKVTATYSSGSGTLAQTLNLTLVVN